MEKDNDKEALKKAKREYKESLKTETEQQTETPKNEESDVHFCCECKHCRLVKRFGRDDRFCLLEMKFVQFFDHPAHREFDYDKSKLCCKINIDGKCTNFDVGGETEIPFKTRQNRP